MNNLQAFQLETNRLKLTVDVASYVQQTFEEYSEEITLYTTFCYTENIADTLDFTNRCLKSLTSGTCLHTIVLNKTTGEFLGRVDITDLETARPEIGLWIKKSAQKMVMLLRSAKP